MVTDISILLARFWGLFLLILGLIFLIRKKLLKDIFIMSKDNSFMLITGFMSLIVGLITLILHNLWALDWRVIVTIFGWLSLAKGIVRLGSPNFTRKTIKLFKDKSLLINGLLILMIILGGWLVKASFY
ncbi:MAG: hypothetical protein Q8Q01_02495 [archaeon]|nr:hypothetical protein [archaeon]